jgi:general secretion pathway protein L
MISELKELFAAWIAATAAAVDVAMARFAQQRRILMTEGPDNDFSVRMSSAGKGADLPEALFRLVQGRPEPSLSAEWLAALRGSRIDLLLRPDRVMFRTMDFPRQAADFLHDMVRAQIDRLTPWTAGDAVFGTTPPAPDGNERIAIVLAATAREKIQPLVKLAYYFAALSMTILVTPLDAGPAAPPIKLLQMQASGSHGLAIDVPRFLRMTLLGAALAAAACLAVSTYLGGMLDSEQRDLQQRIAQRRLALRSNQAGASADTLLAKRKQTTPSSVMVLEAISQVLPDTTYATELRIEGDKMQVVGLTQDAPSLIRLIEQSPQFNRATFFAPTTRSQNDPGERFHIEARITPYFGSGS